MIIYCINSKVMFFNYPIDIPKYSIIDSALIRSENLKTGFCNLSNTRSL